MTLIAIYTFFKKELGQHEKLNFSEKMLPFAAIGIGAFTGFYNGFVGPGTGSLLVFGFVSVVGYNFLTASAYSKVVNFIADIASLFFFLVHGFVVFQIAIPMMFCNMIGSYIGSKTALKNGSGFVRIMFLIVVSILMLRFGWDIFKTLK